MKNFKICFKLQKTVKGLNPAVEKIVRNCDKDLLPLSGSPRTLPISPEQLLDIGNELLKLDSLYTKVEELNVEIKAKLNFDNNSPKLHSSNITAALISDDYICLNVSDDYYTCVKGKGEKIVKISTTKDAIFDSFSK